MQARLWANSRCVQHVNGGQRERTNKGLSFLIGIPLISELRQRNKQKVRLQQQTQKVLPLANLASHVHE